MNESNLFSEYSPFVFLKRYWLNFGVSPDDETRQVTAKSWQRSHDPAKNLELIKPSTQLNSQPENEHTAEHATDRSSS